MGLGPWELGQWEQVSGNQAVGSGEVGTVAGETGRRNCCIENWVVRYGAVRAVSVGTRTAGTGRRLSGDGTLVDTGRQIGLGHLAESSDWVCHLAELTGHRVVLGSGRVVGSGHRKGLGCQVGSSGCLAKSLGRVVRSGPVVRLGRTRQAGSSGRVIRSGRQVGSWGQDVRSCHHVVGSSRLGSGWVGSSDQVGLSGPVVSGHGRVVVQVGSSGLLFI